MMKSMMKKMMPMMGGVMEDMDFSEKEKMMDQMMPRMMGNMSPAEKARLMKKMMPNMMCDMDPREMSGMMEEMMPTMMDKMEESGINMLSMMKEMCPKCFGQATSRSSKEDKEAFKKHMSTVIAGL